MLLYWVYRFCRRDLFTCKNFIDSAELCCMLMPQVYIYIIIYTLELKLVVNSYQNNVVKH